MVDKEMAATSAAIEEAVRRIDVSFKHTYLPRFCKCTVRPTACLMNLLFIKFTQNHGCAIYAFLNYTFNGALQDIWDCITRP